LHVKENFNFGLGVTPTDPTADKTTNLDKVGSSDFYGIGPRVGAEIYYPIGETWGPVGISGRCRHLGPPQHRFGLQSFR
jgi:hypothetical protein